MSTNVSEKLERDNDVKKITLTEYSSYLLIPNKFLQPYSHLFVHSRTGYRRLFVHYSFERNKLCHIQTLSHNVSSKIDFFGIIYPNGIIKQRFVRVFYGDDDICHIEFENTEVIHHHLSDLELGGTHEENSKYLISYVTL